MAANLVIDESEAVDEEYLRESDQTSIDKLDSDNASSSPKHEEDGHGSFSSNNNGQGQPKYKGTCPSVLKGERCWALSRKKLCHYESHEPPSEKTHVYVCRLPLDFSKDDLESLFKPFGPIVDTRLLTDSKTGDFRGAAFVYFKEPGDAKKAIQAVHMMRLNTKGPAIQCRFAEKKKRIADSPYGAYAPRRSYYESEKIYEPVSRLRQARGYEPYDPIPPRSYGQQDRFYEPYDRIERSSYRSEYYEEYPPRHAPLGKRLPSYEDELASALARRVSSYEDDPLYPLGRRASSYQDDTAGLPPRRFYDDVGDYGAYGYR